MPGPFTFGVELEFCVEWTHSPQPKHEQKTVVFPPPLKDRGTIGNFTMIDRIQKHVVRTIADNGFRIDVNCPRNNNINNWEVTFDLSICPPREQHSEYGDETRQKFKIDDEEQINYQYQGIEVVSRAFPFNEDSLNEVERMCRILNKTYRLSVNESTGLHVHLGHGKQGFKLKDLKELTIFLYTFELQLSSFHPLDRYSHEYGRALRYNSAFTVNFQKKYNRIPKASDFAANINACKKRATWFSLTQQPRPTLRNNYNFVGVSLRAVKGQIISACDPRQTVEFRQHRGTIDGREITQWVRTIVGIVGYVETALPVDRHKLLSTIWEEETWEKMGDGKDRQRAAELGPALADEGFTIIDLLEHIGLSDQADYYRNRWQKHEIEGRPTYLGSNVTWDFQQTDSGIYPNDKVYQRKSNLAEHFEALRLFTLAGRLAGDEAPRLDFSPFPALTIDLGQESDDIDEEPDYEE